MALKIRLQRKGSKNNPKYRLVVAEASSPRDGRCIEDLGHYNPNARGQEVEFNMNEERVAYWQSVGAQPSDTASNLIKRFRKASKTA